MKSLILFIVTFIFSSTTFSQLNFNTGSKELDADLNSINVSAEADLGAFKAELSTDFDVKSGEIDKLFSLSMEPAEVYLTLEISRISNHSPSEVAASYKQNKSKGWGYIAKQMGIKPGSAEFHELKGKSKNKKSSNGKSKGGSKGNGKGNSKGNGKSKP